MAGDPNPPVGETAAVTYIERSDAGEFDNVRASRHGSGRHNGTVPPEAVRIRHRSRDE